MSFFIPTEGSGTEYQQSCGHCLDSNGCDQSTGECRTGCEDGYYPPACKKGMFLVLGKSFSVVIVAVVYIRFKLAICILQYPINVNIRIHE